MVALGVRFVEPWDLVTAVGDQLHDALVLDTCNQGRYALIELIQPISYRDVHYRRLFVEATRNPSIDWRAVQTLHASATAVSLESNSCAAALAEAAAWRGGGLAGRVDLELR